MTTDQKSRDAFDIVAARNALKPEALKLLRQPVVQSLLYDINLLPEQITSEKHWFYMLAVLMHFDAARADMLQDVRMAMEALEAAEALLIFDGYTSPQATAKSVLKKALETLRQKYGKE